MWILTKILRTLVATLFVASTLTLVLACASKTPDASSNNDLTVVLGNATQAQIVQTAVALSSATKVARDRISSVTPNYSDPSMQQMGQLVQSCTYSPSTSGGGALNGTSCPISYSQKFVGSSSPSSFSGQSTTNYSANTVQYQGLNLVQNFIEIANINSGFPSSPSTFSFNGIVGTASWGFVSFTGTSSMTAANTSGQYTSTSTITGNSAKESAVFGIADTGHVDPTTGNPVVDSETCTLNSAVVTCASIGQ